MSLNVYRVRYESLNFTPTDRELDFLDKFAMEDPDCTSRYYVDEEQLEELVKDLEEEGEEVPQGVVAFLKEAMGEEGALDFDVV